MADRTLKEIDAQRSATSASVMRTQVLDAQEWMAGLLGWPTDSLDTSSIDPFFGRLQSGVAVCQLLERISSEFAVKFNANAQPGSFQARDNIANFVTKCREIGVPQLSTFESDDLVLRKNDKSVINTLYYVARIGLKHGIAPPRIIALELEINNHEAFSKWLADGATGAPPVAESAAAAPDASAPSADEIAEYDGEEEHVLIRNRGGSVAGSTVASPEHSPRRLAADAAAAASTAAVAAAAAAAAAADGQSDAVMIVSDDSSSSSSGVVMVADDPAPAPASTLASRAPAGMPTLDMSHLSLPGAGAHQDRAPNSARSPALEFLDEVDTAIRALVRANNFKISIRKIAIKNKKRRRDFRKGEYRIGSGPKLYVRLVHGHVIARVGHEWVDFVDAVRERMAIEKQLQSAFTSA